MVRVNVSTSHVHDAVFLQRLWLGALAALLMLLGCVSMAHAQTQTTISGTIYEDLNGDSLLADAVARTNVNVRVYADTNGDNVLNSTDTHIADAVTGSDGRYSITVTPATTGNRYFVAVDSRSITPSAGFNAGFAQGDVWSEQTYGDDWRTATLDLAARYNGRGEEMIGQSNTSDQYRSSPTFTNNPYRHLAFVDVSSGSVTKLDWGFSFNVVTNTRAGAGTDHDTATSARRTVQGSFRQFLQNANAVAGSNTLRFVPTVGVSVGSVWRIDVTVPLPALTDGGTMIDGTAYQWTDGVTVRDQHTGQIGTGGTVGADQTPLAQINKPEFEIWNRRSGAVVDVGLDIQASDVTIRNVAVYGFGSTPNSDMSANVRIGSTAGNILIERSIIGTSAASFSDPGSARTGGDNVRVLGGSGTLRQNLIGFAAGNGVALSATALGWTIEGNEIRGNALGTAGSSGVQAHHVGTVRANLIAANHGAGIQATGARIERNTITGNGIGTDSSASDAGVRLSGTGGTVAKNVITGNYGAGVLLTTTATGNLISQNAIHANGTITNVAGGGPTNQLGIDLLSPSDDQLRGTVPFVTRNDAGDADGGGNDLHNFPVLERALLGDGMLTVSGWAASGAQIELFVAAPDASGFGEGQTYLATFAEGSAADQDGTAGTYFGLINSLDQGIDTAQRFRFELPAPSGVTHGSKLTATATVAGATSEFSGVVTVEAAPTAITLVDFTATPGSQHIALRWETALEHNTHGFYIYRSSTGLRQNAVRVSPLILAQGPSLTGSAYSWIDADVAPGVYRYWLQEVEVGGASYDYGPVTAAVGKPWQVFVPAMR